MSRILGPEFGGSIGIIFALANAINASLNVVGFSQTLQDVMKTYGGYIIVDGGINDTRIIGTIVIIAVWGLCGLGAKYESKVNLYNLPSLNCYDCDTEILKKTLLSVASFPTHYCSCCTEQFHHWKHHGTNGFQWKFKRIYWLWL